MEITPHSISRRRLLGGAQSCLDLFFYLTVFVWIPLFLLACFTNPVTASALPQVP